MANFNNLLKELVNMNKRLRIIEAVLQTKSLFVRETWLQMIPQWQNNWTDSATYVDIDGALNAINFNDWPDHSWYFEIIAKTDDGIGYYRLYNVTTGVAISGSEVSTSSTTPVRLRSGSLPKPVGTNVIKVQYKKTGGAVSNYANAIMSRSVFRID